jgi:hypothetical protein
MKCCNQKKGVERKISYARVTHSRNTTLENLNTINFDKLHIKTINLVLLEIPLVLLNCWNKVQCSMCQLYTHGNLSLTCRNGNKQFGPCIEP